MIFFFPVLPAHRFSNRRSTAQAPLNVHTGTQVVFPFGDIPGVVLHLQAL